MACRSCIDCTAASCTAARDQRLSQQARGSPSCAVPTSAQRFREHRTPASWSCQLPATVPVGLHRLRSREATHATFARPHVRDRSSAFLCVPRATNGSRRGASAVTLDAFTPLLTSAGTSVQTCGGQTTPERPKRTLTNAPHDNSSLQSLDRRDRTHPALLRLTSSNEPELASPGDALMRLDEVRGRGRVSHVGA